MNINLAQIQEVFNNVFAENPVVIAMETKKDDLEQWDSLGHLNLVLELEDTFDISLDADDILNIKSVNDIIEILKKY